MLTPELGFWIILAVCALGLGLILALAVYGVVLQLKGYKDGFDDWEREIDDEDAYS